MIHMKNSLLRLRIRDICLQKFPGLFRGVGTSGKLITAKRVKLDSFRESGHDLYPPDFHTSLSLHQFIGTYKGTEKGVQYQLLESVAGRVLAIRGIFYDLHADGVKIQVVVCSAAGMEDDMLKVHRVVRRGDIVGVLGRPGVTHAGELSIYATSLVILSPCLHVLPKLKFSFSESEAWVPGMIRNTKTYAIQDKKIRYEKRYLDLMLHKDVQQIFRTRAQIISYIRKFLDTRDFLEVETPMMNLVATGGAARPFETCNNDLKMKLYMRIAPELYLKEVLVGGLHRVYEIGKQFRNEGIDSTHYPEFTTCEFYMAFASAEDLMTITEEMLSGLVMDLTGGYKVKYQANGQDKDSLEIDFTPPFRRIDMIDELEKLAGITIPRPFSSDEANKYLADLCLKLGIKCTPPRRTARLLDKLVGHFLEELCVHPTFIINHPEIMSPLAKSHRSKPGLTERFELFVNKSELCNAYSEVNDPNEQRQRFAEQLKLREAGDHEAMTLDETYCTALEYGLPPCAGWGIGIDRLTMLLTDSQNIKDVILFTNSKPQVKPTTTTVASP